MGRPPVFRPGRERSRNSQQLTLWQPSPAAVIYLLPRIQNKNALILGLLDSSLCKSSACGTREHQGLRSNPVAAKASYAWEPFRGGTELTSRRPRDIWEGTQSFGRPGACGLFCARMIGSPLPLCTSGLWLRYEKKQLAGTVCFVEEPRVICTLPNRLQGVACEHTCA